MMRSLLLVACCAVCSLQLLAQGSGLPLGNPTYHILDRLEITSGVKPDFHSSLRYYTRGQATRYALTVDTARVPITVKDRRDLYYIFRDNNEWLGSVDEKTTISGTRVNAMPGADTPVTMIEASMENARYTMNEKPVFGFLYQTPANLF
ncbi:MAG: hypothetical protein MRY78_12545, partial [Saprospiraceae bacterium]|nr:hypothetical protein [Saprospiraceae bacterium]